MQVIHSKVVDSVNIWSEVILTLFRQAGTATIFGEVLDVALLMGKPLSKTAIAGVEDTI
jgi:hypothetical protein